MKLNDQRKSHAQPRLVEIRKPLRPVRVAKIRQPIKTTAPFVLGERQIVPKPIAAR